MLWLLERILAERKYPPYDETLGFVVRASTEAEARRVADANVERTTDHRRWGDSSYASCEPIDPDGPDGMILRDYNAG